MGAASWNVGRYKYREALYRTRRGGDGEVMSPTQRSLVDCKHEGSLPAAALSPTTLEKNFIDLHLHFNKTSTGGHIERKYSRGVQRMKTIGRKSIHNRREQSEPERNVMTAPTSIKTPKGVV